MQDLTGDLHKMGEHEVVDIFKVKRTSPDIFDRILHLFYIKRHPLSIGQICEDLDVDYPITHKVISKLVHIGILSIEEGEKTGNQFILSQKGIDFYLNYSTLELGNKITEIVSKKHSIFVLRLLIRTRVEKVYVQRFRCRYKKRRESSLRRKVYDQINFYAKCFRYYRWVWWTL